VEEIEKQVIQDILEEVVIEAGGEEKEGKEKISPAFLNLENKKPTY
jgi:hypothetical protein